jgi:hypothetical protein
MATPNLQRIQVIKQESAALGGDPADDFPFDSPIEPQEDAVETAGVYLQDSSNRDEEVLVTRSGDNMMFYDVTVGSGVSLLQLLEGESAGTGMTPNQHKSLRQLIHFTDTNSPGDGFGAGPYQSEVNYQTTVFPSDETWYTTTAKTAKICRWEATYNPNRTFATETWKVYQTNGTDVAAQADDVITYDGIKETGRERTITVY